MYALNMASGSSMATNASPLHVAAASGDISEMKKAIAKASSRGGLFRSSTKENFNIDVQDANGMTPLMVATARGHLDLVQYLLEKTTPKPNLNLTDIIGWTAIHHAVNEAQLHVAAYLIEKGVNLTFKTKQNETVLHLLIKSAFAPSKPQYEALISRLAKAPGSSWNGSIIDVSDTQGETALHIACSQGNEKAVVCLLENNSDPNSKNNHTGETALHVAVRLCSTSPRSVRILTLLLNNGASTNIPNNENLTPVGLAVSLGAGSQVVEILKAHEKTRTEREEQIQKRKSGSMAASVLNMAMQTGGEVKSVSLPPSQDPNTNLDNDRKLDNMVSQLKTSIRLQKHISQKALIKEKLNASSASPPPSRAPPPRPSSKTSVRPRGAPPTPSHARTQSEQVPVSSIQRISTANIEPIKKKGTSTSNLTSTTTTTTTTVRTVGEEPVAESVTVPSLTTAKAAPSPPTASVNSLPAPAPVASKSVKAGSKEEVIRPRSSSLTPDINAPSPVPSPSTQHAHTPPTNIQVPVPQGTRSRSNSVNLVDEQEEEGENARSELLHALRCQSAYIPPTLLAMLESEPVSDYKEAFLLDHQQVRLKEEIPHSLPHTPKLFRAAVQVWKPIFIQRVPYSSSEGETIKRMLEDEMEMLKQVHHPHLVSYLGSTLEYNWINIATEVTEGGSLADLLAQETSFSEAFSANVLVQVLEGLIYLHKRKIVHKSLTPANILFTEGGKVKLSNYLSSTKILYIESQKRIDPDFTVLDPNYTAPEVVNNFSFSPASDIWSLGCCIVEMLTGKPPFDDYEGPAVAIQVSLCTEMPVEKVTKEKLSKPCLTFLTFCFKLKAEDRPQARSLIGSEFIRDNLVPEDNLFQTLINLKEPENTRVIEEEVKAYQRQLDEGLKWLLGALDSGNKKQSARFHTYIKGLVSKVKNDPKLKDLQAIRFHLQYADELMQRYQTETAASSASSSSSSGSGSGSGSSSSSSSSGSALPVELEKKGSKPLLPITPTTVTLNDDEEEEEEDLDDLDLDNVDFQGW